MRGHLRRLIVVSVMLGCGSSLSSCREEKSIAAKVALANKVSQREITLYFESPDMKLVAEKRTVALPENEAAALPSVLTELLKGSANSAIPRTFPSDVVLRGAFLLSDGTAVIDLGGPTLADGWNTGSHTEIMAIYSIVETVVANAENAQQVRLVIEGKPAETLAGHIEIDRPLRSILGSPRSPLQ